MSYSGGLKYLIIHSLKAKKSQGRPYSDYILWMTFIYMNFFFLTSNITNNSKDVVAQVNANVTFHKDF